MRFNQIFRTNLLSRAGLFAAMMAVPAAHALAATAFADPLFAGVEHSTIHVPETGSDVTAMVNIPKISVPTASTEGGARVAASFVGAAGTAMGSSADHMIGKKHSLTELVAARAGVDSAIGDELRCLASAVYFEAKGEPLTGQLAVAEVILNRVQSGRFARSLCGVVKQPSQFSFVRGGRIPPVTLNAAWSRALGVARVAMEEAASSPAEEALYFHARYVSPGWQKVRVAALGNHIFYR